MVRLVPPALISPNGAEGARCSSPEGRMAAGAGTAHRASLRPEGGRALRQHGPAGHFIPHTATALPGRAQWQKYL